MTACREQQGASQYYSLVISSIQGENIHQTQKLKHLMRKSFFWVLKTREVLILNACKSLYQPDTLLTYSL